MSEQILQVRNISKEFGSVLALNNVSLDILAGECHAIVGESGSGKSTLANIILGIFPPTTGEMIFEGQTLSGRRTAQQRQRIQLVQQNPLSSLNPRRSIGASIRLPLDVHRIGTPSERRRRVEELLVEVDLDPDMARRSPASLSGGQRQRVAIARALAAMPELIVLDEPTSALDVLVQARVLALLDKLRRERGLTYIFITHDLAVVRAIADRISVFAAGELVESGNVSDIFERPQAEFTRDLISAVPVITDEEARLRDAVRISRAAPTSQTSNSIQPGGSATTGNDQND